MKRNFLAPLCLFFFVQGYAQIPTIGPAYGSAPAPSAVNWTHVGPDIKTATEYAFQNMTYDIFAVKVNSNTLRKFDVIENSGDLKHQDFLAMVNKDSTFLINASVAGLNGKPIGYYVKAAEQFQDINSDTGRGNFYLKPNGALLLTTSDAIICETSQIRSQSNVVLGLQSGPMLVINGDIHPGFNPKSANVNLRCGVGIFSEDNEKYLVFCISSRVVNFYSFAMLFQSLNCANALSLDNAGVAMYFPHEGNPNGGFDYVIHNYLVYKY